MANELRKIQISNTENLGPFRELWEFAFYSDGTIECTWYWLFREMVKIQSGSVWSNFTKSIPASVIGQAKSEFNRHIDAEISRLGELKTKIDNAQVEGAEKGE